MDKTHQPCSKVQDASEEYFPWRWCQVGAVSKLEQIMVAGGGTNGMSRQHL